MYDNLLPVLPFPLVALQSCLTCLFFRDMALYPISDSVPQSECEDFLVIDRCIIGLKNFVEPFAIHGFCSGLSLPNISSLRSSSVLDNMLKMLAFSSCVSIEAYLISSPTSRSSGPISFLSFTPRTTFSYLLSCEWSFHLTWSVISVRVLSSRAWKALLTMRLRGRRKSSLYRSVIIRSNKINNLQSQAQVT